MSKTINGMVDNRAITVDVGQQYRFYATIRDAFTHRYLTYTLVDAGTDQEAIHKLAVEHEMKLAELDPDGVWMEMKDGALVKYDVSLA